MTIDLALSILGYSGMLLTTICFLPQLIHTWRTKSASDLSLHMYLLLVSSILVWITYGSLRQDWPIVITNAISLVITSIILVLKLRYR